MNIKRKTEMQERRIASLQKQIETLKNENEALRKKNQELEDKETHHNEQMKMMDELRKEYFDGIDEMNAIKIQYQEAVYEARKMKKEFAKQFKPLIKRLKAQI